jgi:hypothetical protein
MTLMQIPLKNYALSIQTVQVVLLQIPSLKDVKVVAPMDIMLIATLILVFKDAHKFMMNMVNGVYVLMFVNKIGLLIHKPIELV